MPRARSNGVLRLATDWPSAMRANVPPSPLLSARTSTITYFSVTMRIKAQKMRDRTPNTASEFAGLPPLAARTASRNA